MRAVVREHLVEAIVGLLVVLLAGWFIVMAWQRTGGGGSGSSIRVTALFPNVSGVGVGTDVRVAGMKVGTVAAERLDPTSYQASLTLALDRTIRIPADSSAAITSEGLLGGSYIALLPGGDSEPLKDGATIADTQGSIDLMGMVGQFINKSSSGADADKSPAADPAR